MNALLLESVLFLWVLSLSSYTYLKICLARSLEWNSIVMKDEL